MRLIDATVKIKEQGKGLDAIYEHIDYCSGICYNRKSVHDNSKKFVDDMIALGHMRPLEFGTVYLTIPIHDVMHGENYEMRELCEKVINNKHSHVVYDEWKGDDFNKNKSYSGNAYVTTNYRVLVENNMLDVLKYMTDRTEFHKRRITVCWNISRGIADEFRTHITLSSLMKSTRYVNEMKWGMEFVKPYWFVDENGEREKNFIEYCKHTESEYNKCIEEFKMKPQEAREYLTLSLGVELYQCGTIGVENEGWDRFFEMRCNKAAHPDARKIADQCLKIFENNFDFKFNK